MTFEDRFQGDRRRKAVWEAVWRLNQVGEEATDERVAEMFHRPVEPVSVALRMAMELEDLTLQGSTYVAVPPPAWDEVDTVEFGYTFVYSEDGTLMGLVAQLEDARLTRSGLVAIAVSDRHSEQ